MNKTSQQLLRDSTRKPTNAIIAECLNDVFDVYDSFIEEMKKYGLSLMEWRFYNDGKAWLSKGEYHWVTSRGTSKVKPIFWLSIWNGFFKISFNFSEKTKEKLMALPLHDDTKERINSIVANGDKMKFLPIIFDVNKKEQFHDIFVLAQFRKETI